MAGRSSTADLYARFCEKATRHLGDLVDYASTFNEPDLPQLFRWLHIPGLPGKSLLNVLHPNLVNVRQQLHAPEFRHFLLGDPLKVRDGLLASHQKGKAAMKSVRSGMPVGFNHIITDDQPVPTDSHLAEKRAEVYGPWLDVAKQCDYLGVHTYSAWHRRRERFASFARR